MCYKYKQIMLTGNGYSDTKQLELTWGDDAVAMSQEECCKKSQVKCHSQGGLN